MTARANTQSRVRVFTKEASIDFVRDALDEQFATHCSKAKAAANAAGTSPRTSEKWLSGDAAPSLHHFLNMVIGPNAVPSLQAEMRRLLADVSDAEISPDQARNQMMRIMQMFEGKI